MKWRKTKATPPNAAADKAAGWIARRIIKVREKWVSAMNRLMSKLSPKGQKVFWIVGIAVMVCYCSSLIAMSFGKGNTTTLRLGSIQRPLSQVTAKKNIPATVSQKALIPIIRFQNYLDSLAKTPDGKRQRDSLLKARPGLMDSLETVERLYCK
ncbi:hypothetical protein MTO98_09720 [Mucilaginibacter sp. SMC90]|uniref:hypothetical protein n=1 Tax=Mucilaginibacter sp. SMC90 TaxID=2929803 RepID=UPI001FB50FD8|nr:hypothetical protein [Mucilaginibacter sp. SMC90]UOE51355.1 hypothetical protein MTO98_09720 [Mucilaginibacter sp. SMC90]